MLTRAENAWDNFVLNSHWRLYERGSERWAASLAKLFMNGANSGGLNAFLTSTWDIAADDIVIALQQIGAPKAADQLQSVATGLHTPLPPTSQDNRWEVLEQGWTDALNALDMLGEEAETELLAALQAHVARHMDFYMAFEHRR